MTLKTKIIKKLKRYRFILEKFPNDEDHKNVDVKYLEMRGRIESNIHIPEITFGSADHVFVTDTKNIFVLQSIDDFLGKMRTVKTYQETNEE